MTDAFSPRQRETLRYGTLQIVKAHVEGRRYRAVVLDYSDPCGAMARKRETGRMYPTVFRATTEGWTKVARAQCRDWVISYQRDQESRGYTDGPMGDGA